MEFQGYQFEEKYFPYGFEDNIRSLVNFNLAFYLKKKYIADENDWIFGDNKTDGEEVVVYCPTNNEFFDIEPKIVEINHPGCGCGAWGYREPICPHEGSCGKTCYLKNAAYKNNDVTRSYDFGFIQQTNRGVVMRVFKCSFDFSDNKFELQREGNFTTKESMRIFFNSDRTTEIYSRLNKGYSGNAGYFISVGYNWKLKKKYQGIADFVNIGEFEGTLLEGFTKYFKLTENFITDDSMQMVLLIALFNVPVLKKIIKAGFLKMAREIAGYFLDDSTVKIRFNRKAQSIKDFFKFDLSKLNRISAVKKDMSLQDLPGLRELNRLGIEFSKENFVMATSEYFVDLLKVLGDREIKATLKYLRTQDDIKAKDRVGDYYDYLNQVYALKLNISEKGIRYPKNLGRAHARLSALLEFTVDPVLQNKYQSQAVRYEKFCYRQGNLSLRAVRTVFELKTWAHRFSNCSGGYVDRIADGRSMIFVIVDRTKYKQPYFMLEYNPKTRKIVQCRSYQNLKDENSDPKVKEFCDKWMEFIRDKKPAKLKEKRISKEVA